MRDKHFKRRFHLGLIFCHNLSLLLSFYVIIYRFTPLQYFFIRHIWSLLMGEIFIFREAVVQWRKEAVVHGSCGIKRQWCRGAVRYRGSGAGEQWDIEAVVHGSSGI
jgi:hypothetical protein